MIQKRRNILFVLVVIAVLITGYGLNMHLDKVTNKIEFSSETKNNPGSLQPDSDAQEDEDSNHVSQAICTIENLSTSFAIKHPSVLKFHAYAVWQPPKNC